MNRLKPKWKALLKFLGPIFFVFIVIRVVDLEAAADLIKKIKLELALSSILLTPVIVFILAVRWHFICQRLGAATHVAKLFQINYISWFLSILPMVGVGIAWASILSLPYALLSNNLPANKMGVYMGIFNFFIVIPQLVAASLLGLLLRGLFGGEAIYCLVAGGVSMAAAGILTLAVDRDAEPVA